MGEMTTSVEIGMKMKELRIKAGLSREKLAELIGLSFQQVHKYETGVNKMNTDKLQLVANALSVPISVFFKNQPIETVPLSDEESNLIRTFRKIIQNDVKKCILTFTDFAASKKQ